MNPLNLFDLLDWHTEQRNELEREEDQENAFQFHSDVVKLLGEVINNFLPVPYELTKKGKAVTK